MDKLAALQMFIETVEAGGFSAAARRLGVATSSVTRMVTALEADLQTVLLNRSTRQVTVTEAGAAYYQNARQILEDLADADAQVKDAGDEPSGPLRVSVPVFLGKNLIAPRLGEFIARYPKVELDVTATDSISALLGDSIDLAIRLGAPAPMEGIVCRTLGRHQRWVVASPGYLAKQGEPEQPAELSQHNCLRFNFGEGQPQEWTFRRGAESEQRLVVRGSYRSNSSEILRAMSLADAGIVLLSDWLVRRDVEQGKLQRLYADYDVTPNDSQPVISALYLPNQRGSKRVNAFIDFCVDVLRTMD